MIGWMKTATHLAQPSEAKKRKSKMNSKSSEPKRMRAAFFKDGQLELLQDCPVPTPAKGEALIKVLQAGICATDLEIFKGYMNFEGILGHEFVGQVVRTSHPSLADRRVVGQINCVCGQCDMCSSGLSNHCRNRTVLGIAGKDGAFAEYLTLPQENLHVIDDKLTNEQSVFVEPLAAAMQIDKQVAIDKRWKIAVLGDGRLGLLVCQVLARLNSSVILVGKHRHKLLVADKKGIRISLVDEIVSRNDYDLVVDCTGSESGLKLAVKMVRPRGTIILKTTIAGPIECDLSPLVINEVRLIGSRCGTFSDAIEALSTGQIDISGLITRSFPLEQIDQALKFAAQPDSIKVLLKMDS